MTGAIELCLQDVRDSIRFILEGVLDGKELSWHEAVVLDTAKGRDLHALCLVADEMRRRQAGDEVSYVVNRNINFTNVCIKSCKFCAFARGVRSEQGYLLPLEEIVRRAEQAVEWGASEVCIQAGLAPDLEARTYLDICHAIKSALPNVHLHAFSPEEIKYGAKLADVPVRDYLRSLKDAGLDTLPGTSAEILDDAMRAQIARGRLTTDEWVEVITSAHEVGLRTSSTMMFGHRESSVQRMQHLDLLRTIQKRTQGFTEFVPLSFVHEEAPLFLQESKSGVRPGPTGDDVIRLYAIARLMLGATFRNIQASWVKEGFRQAQWLLHCGVNDLGGTLMNESISTAAGASHGQLATPATLRKLIRAAGRVPIQRNTTYGVVQRFESVSTDPTDALDTLENPDEVFGSYSSIVNDPRFHYEPRGRRTLKIAN
ncbi:MAG: 5-amino-6-(D-ribitylamino)uracil--L-tyrosine 4-hydroxyphenyl transferase CofH [Polyangiales bacterium]